MPKKVNLLPNERVDIIDLSQAAQDYAQQLEKQLVNRGMLDKFCRINDGFRVEIANQGTNPGVFTVHNGVAFDRAGQLVNNEDDLNTSRSLTLSIDGTYFVEVQFTSVASDVDARAFWDPTFDNGADPSGDLRIPGREFSQNVATRLSPDWQIVTPVSTTGFELASNPNSTKIPLAVIVRSGGVITGASTVPAKSTLQKSAVATETSLKVFDSRLMPNSFTGTVDAEAIVVTANDKENGILTLSSGLSLAHSVGARVAVTGGSPTQYLPERTTPISVTQALPTAGPTVDARPRMWGGDEERGFGLTQDPYTASGRNDVQVKGLKDYVDLVAGQIREIKWGSSASAGFGKTAPTIPGSTPRYYDYAGGLFGTRSHTVSVGDGVNSWGDFNTTGFTTSGGDTAAKQAIQAAINSIPFLGGILYLKRGTYDIGANPIVLDRPTMIMGDGKFSSVIRGAGSSTAIAPTATSDLHFEKVGITQPAGATTSAIKAAVTVIRMTMRDCDVTGVELTAIDHGYFSNCVFNGPDSTSGSDDPFDATLTNSLFENCDFNEFSTGNSNCLNVRASSLETSFYRCKFAGSSTINDRIVFVDNGSTRISFLECRLIGGNVNTYAFTAGANVTFLTLRDCSTSTNAGLLNAILDGNTDFFIENCQAVFDNSSAARRCINIVHSFPTASCRHRILKCNITQTGVRDAQSGIGIWLEASSDNFVESNILSNVDIGIGLKGVNGSIFANNKHLCDFGFGRIGVVHDSNAASYGNHYYHNTYLGMSDNTGFIGGVAGIDLGSQTGGKTHVEGNEFLSIGQSVATIDAWGLICNNNTSAGHYGLHIHNNWFENIQGGGSGNKGSEAIRLVGGTTGSYGQLRITGNMIFNIGNAVVNNFSSGISISKYNHLVIANNTFESIGNAGAVDNAGVVIGWETTTPANGEDYTITGNTFRNIQGPGALNTACIEVLQGGLRGVISNNICEINNSNVNGILVSGNSSAAENGSVSICGNVIEGVHPRGIVVVQPANKGINKRYSIANNIIRDSHVDAILVDLGDDDDFPFPACTVTGNIIESGDGSVTGIAVLDCDMASVTGNSISLPNSSQYGVFMLFCRRFTVNDNCIFVPTSDIGVRVDSCSTGNMVGNQLIACLGSFVNGGKFWVAGNHAAISPSLLISAVAFESGGAVAYQTTRGLNLLGPDNSGTTPTGNADHWLNLSTP